MAKYIECEKFKEKHICCGYLPEMSEDEFDAFPVADVRPERHGRWIKDGDVLVCSECGEEHAWDDYRATYCEDCGAKMDEGTE